MSALQRAYWVLFAVTLANFLAMVLWSGPLIMSNADGMPPFDTRIFGYTETQARDFLGALNDVGRGVYLGVQSQLDMSFPVLLALTLGIAIWWLFDGLPRSFRAQLALLSFVAAGFDYLENARVTEMLNASLNDITGPQIAAASRATVVKYVFDLAAIVVVVIGLFRARRRKRVR